MAPQPDGRATQRRVRRLVQPVGKMVLIRHDKDKDRTSGGLVLPNSSAIPVLTGVVVAVPDHMKENHLDYPFNEGDRVIYDTRRRIPVDLEPSNNHYLVEAEYIYGLYSEQEIPEDDLPPQRDFPAEDADADR